MGDPDTGSVWRTRNAQKVPTRGSPTDYDWHSTQWPKDNIVDEQTRIQDSSIIARPWNRGTLNRETLRLRERNILFTRDWKSAVFFLSKTTAA